MEPNTTSPNEAKMQEMLNLLEKLKQEWNESAPGVPFPRIAVDEEELRNQLRKNVSTEYTKLYKYYRGWWKADLFCAPLTLLFTILMTPYDKWTIGIVTVLFIFASVFWNTYIIKQVRKLDISVMPLTEYSYRLNQVRKWLNWDLPLGMIIVIIMYVFIFGHTNPEGIIVSTICCLTFLLFVFRGYLNRIRNVSQSLRELEEFDTKEESQ